MSCDNSNTGSNKYANAEDAVRANQWRTRGVNFFFFFFFAIKYEYFTSMYQSSISERFPNAACAECRYSGKSVSMLIFHESDFK